MNRRVLLSRMQTGLFLLCSVTYVASLIYFAAALPDTIYTQLDNQGRSTTYMGKWLFMAIYTLLMLIVLPVQFSERLRAVSTPNILRRLCGAMNEQASRLGRFADPLVWRWIALPFEGFLLFIFLTICLSNYRQAGA